MFCDKISKNKKGTNPREPLRCCTELRVDKKINKITVDRHDSILITLTSEEWVRNYTKYHPRCYKTCLNAEKPPEDQNDSLWNNIARLTNRTVTSIL